MKKLFRKIKRRIAKIGTLNVILVIVGLFFVWFNCQMLNIYMTVGSIPESYACAVVAATIGECGICGWIRINKDKQQKRKWDKEDYKKGIKGHRGTFDGYSMGGYSEYSGDDNFTDYNNY
jgi:hypothetical protein